MKWIWVPGSSSQEMDLGAHNSFRTGIKNKFWKQGLTYDGVGFYHKPNSLLELENPNAITYGMELENPTPSLMIGN